MTPKPSELCIPHSCGLGSGGVVIIGGLGSLGGIGGGGGLTHFFLQHTSISFLHVVFLLSIRMVTGLEPKVSSIRPCSSSET